MVDMNNDRVKFVLLLFIIFFSFIPDSVEASKKTEIEDARNKVQNSFRLVLEAYEAGGDVVDLVYKLNEALNLILKAEDADPSQVILMLGQADEITEDVEILAPSVRDDGIGHRQFERTTLILTIIGIAVGLSLSYVYGPKLFLTLWFRMRRDYVVKVAEDRKPVEDGSLFASGEVWAVVIAVVLLVTVFSISEAYYSTKVIEPFSELGILGPNMMIDNYPNNVTVGETIRLNVYVSNHLGEPTYYVVMVKLRDNETVLDPASGNADVALDLVLMHDEERITPFNMTIDKSGLNQRLIFELWVFNASNGQIEYHDRYGWLWLNVRET